MSLFHLAVFFCFAVDASNPLLPGSIRLDPSESIQALAAAAGAHGQPARSGSRLTPAPLPVDQPLSTRPARPFVANTLHGWPPWTVWPSRHHPGERALAPPSDDH